MAFQLSEAAQARLAALAVEYRRSLAGKADGFVAMRQAWLADDDLDQLGQLVRGVHQVRGSASLYGCADVSSAAERSEPLLRGNPRSAEATAALDALIEAMKSAASESGGRGDC